MFALSHRHLVIKNSTLHKNSTLRGNFRILKDTNECVSFIWIILMLRTHSLDPHARYYCVPSQAEGDVMKVMRNGKRGGTNRCVRSYPRYVWRGQGAHTAGKYWRKYFKQKQEARSVLFFVMKARVNTQRYFILNQGFFASLFYDIFPRNENIWWSRI